LFGDCWKRLGVRSQELMNHEGTKDTKKEEERRKKEEVRDIEY
jgi:hypothetical protein